MGMCCGSEVGVGGALIILGMSHHPHWDVPLTSQWSFQVTKAIPRKRPSLMDWKDKEEGEL